MGMYRRQGTITLLCEQQWFRRDCASKDLGADSTLSCFVFPQACPSPIAPNSEQCAREVQGTGQALSTSSPPSVPTHSNRRKYGISGSSLELCLLLKIERGGMRTFKNIQNPQIQMDTFPWGTCIHQHSLTHAAFFTHLSWYAPATSYA